MSADKGKTDHTWQRLGLPLQALAVVPQAVAAASSAAAAAAGDSSGSLAGASAGPSLAERQQQYLENKAELARQTAGHPQQPLTAPETSSTLLSGPEEGGVHQSLVASTRRFAGLSVSAGGAEASRGAGPVSESTGMGLLRQKMQRLMEFMSNVSPRVSGLETRSTQATYSAGPGPEGASLMIGPVPGEDLLPASVGGGGGGGGGLKVARDARIEAASWAVRANRVFWCLRGRRGAEIVPEADLQTCRGGQV